MSFDKLPFIQVILISLFLSLFVYVPGGQLVLQQESIQKDNLQCIKHFHKS